MRAATDELRRALADGGFTTRWVFDLMYNNDRQLADVEVSRPDLSWDGGRFVTGAGSVRVLWSDDHARSIIPRQIGDMFSPFGAEMQVDCLITAGTFSERVPMGRFVVSEIPDAEEARLLWEGRLIHAGESFTVNLADRLAKVERDDFPFPTAPTSSSAWDEVQTITGIPVVRNVPDAEVPTSTAYEGPRDEALKGLFDVLDAWPHMDSAGALTARSKTWGSPVDELVNVVAAPPSMTAQYTYNRVVAVGKSPEGDPIYGVKEITDGFLRVRNADGSQSPFGGATYRYQSDLLTTQGQVDAYAASLLPRVARIRSVTRDITEPFNPLREVGDVLMFRGGLVRVQKVSHPGAVTRLTVEVADA